MKIRFSILLLLIINHICTENLYAQKLVFLTPTEDFHNEFPVMEPWDMSDTLAQNLKTEYLNSYIKENLRLYQYVQNFLVNMGSIEQAEPVYVAFSNNQGGFPEMGFYLQTDSGLIDKTHAGYVDFHKSSLTSPLNEVGSDSQILPHELGHIILKYLCIPGKEHNGASTDMHYFPIVTDYWTAFNEGFAEHFEIISHQLEQNNQIKEGIERDLEEIPQKVKKKIEGYKRDFKLPLRAGLYRASTITWFQRYEMYRRHAWVHSEKIRYQTNSIKTRSLDDKILYRNTGVSLNPEIRNYEQMLSTEGVISLFFYKLVNSEIKDHYLDKSFYDKFLPKKERLAYRPEEKFKKIENAYLKIFAVISKFVYLDYSDYSNLYDFMNGYIQEFPDEEEYIKKIFRQSIGYEFTKPGKELWLLNKGFNHQFISLIQYGASLPFYSLNLNTANRDDLLTLRLAENDIDAILYDRDINGCYNSIEDLIQRNNKIGNQTIHLLKESQFDTQYIENQYSSLNLQTLLMGILRHFAKVILLLFLLLLIIQYFLVIRRSNIKIKKFWYITGKFFKVVLFFVAAMISVMTDTPIIWFLLFIIGISGLSYLFYRKKGEHLIDALSGTAVLTLFFIYAIV